MERTPAIVLQSRAWNTIPGNPDWNDQPRTDLKPGRNSDGLQGPLSVVDDNPKVVGALSVVGATKISNCSQDFVNTLR